MSLPSPASNTAAAASAAPASVYAAIDGQPPMRWGILGTGKIAEDFALALSPCRSLVVQSIGSRSLSSAQQFAKLCSVPTAHGSYESLVTDPEVDIIYIATPTAFHAEHALLALRAGKHVMVEKPFAASVADAQRVLEEAQRRGLTCLEAMWTRYCPAIDSALSHIRKGTIGRVLSVQSDFGCQFAIPSGALDALGCYCIALSQMVFEANKQREHGAATAEAPSSSSSQSQPLAAQLVVPSKLQALGSLNASGIDTQIGAQMMYASDQLSQWSASLLVNGACEATITGERGRIRLPGPLWHSASQLHVLDSTESFESCELPLSAFGRSFNLLHSQRLVHEALEMNLCVRAKQGQSSKWNHGQIVQTMRIMEQIRSKIREP